MPPCYYSLFSGKIELVVDSIPLMQKTAWKVELKERRKIVGDGKVDTIYVLVY